MTNNSATYLYNKALILAESDEYDWKKVEHLLVKAAELGSCDAQYALGSWYFYGRHYEISIQKAEQYWTMAAENGSAEAALELAIAYEKGDVIKKKIKSAFCYYNIASLLGSAQAKFELSRFFYHGIYVPKNLHIYEILICEAESAGYKDCAGNGDTCNNA